MFQRTIERNGVGKKKKKEKKEKKRKEKKRKEEEGKYRQTGRDAEKTTVYESWQRWTGIILWSANGNSAEGILVERDRLGFRRREETL
uniref:Uncharacterized protein n=1 Tax=Vespula pensylvanica TaxID=30213 RepID=A0A834MZ60_VESPE|nr:hypothetical protein H0235_017644 [Vespula pensylvanica]